MKLKLLMAAVCTAMLSISAAAADWIVDAAAKTITDGDWTFPITPVAAAKTFTLGQITTKAGATGSGTELDFRNNAIKDADGAEWQMTAFDKSFHSLSAVTRILLPDTVTDAKTYAFYNCAELAYVRLSDNITTFGSSSFRSCAKLTTVEPLLPSKVTAINLSSSFGAPISAETIVFGDGTNDITWTTPDGGGFGSASIANVIFSEGITVAPGKLFRQTQATQNITFPSTLTEIRTYFYSDVANKTAAKVITFNSAPPTFGTYAFSTIGALTAKIVVPYDSWQSVLADSSKFTPYDEATHGESWQAMFPGEAAPDGVLNAGWTGKTGAFNQDQWVVAVRSVSEHSKLYVVGSPDAYGAVEPAYGTTEFETAAASCALSAPEYYVDGDDLYICRGYDYQTQNDDENWTDPVRVAKLADTFSVSAKTTARVTWIWEKVGARLSAGCDSERGTVTVSPDPVFGGCYLYDTEVTLTAEPKDQVTFDGWYEPGLDGGKAESATIKLSVTEARSAFAYFPTTWQHIGKTLVGNGWTIPVDKEGTGELTVKKPTATLPGAAVIDLRDLSIDDGSTIVAVDGLVSDGASTATLVELYLPETVTSLGSYFCYAQPNLRKVVRPKAPVTVGMCYCRECPKLETVESMDLSSVAAFERIYYCSSCPKLTGEVMFGDGVNDPFVTAVKLDANGGYFCFDCNVSKATIAEGVGALPRSTIRGCPLLTEVVLPSTLTNAMNNSLSGLTGLRRLVMPNVPTVIGPSALVLGASARQVRVVIPQDGSGGWSEILADSEKFRKLTDEERAAFKTENPNEKVPFGILLKGAWQNVSGTVAPGADQYLVRESLNGLSIILR